MRQPKYKFGDQFTTEEAVEYKGITHKLTVVGYITSIQQTHGTDPGDYDYEYNLSSSFQTYGKREGLGKFREHELERKWEHVTI